MCPKSPLGLSARTFTTFGRPSRYVVSGARGGGRVPVGFQAGGLYLAGMAYFNGGAYAVTFVVVGR